MHSLCIASRVTVKSNLNPSCHTCFAFLCGVLSGRLWRRKFAFWALIPWGQLENDPRIRVENKKLSEYSFNHQLTFSLTGISCFAICSTCATSAKLTAVWLGTRHEVGSPGYVLSWCRWALEGLLSPNVPWNGSHRRTDWGFGQLRPWQWWRFQRAGSRIQPCSLPIYITSWNECSLLLI